MSRDFQHSFLTHQSTPFGPLTHFLYKMVQHGFDFAELFEFSRNPAESMHDYNREVNLLQHCRVRDENIVQVSGCFSRVNKLKYFYRITSIIGEQIFSKKWGFTRIKLCDRISRCKFFLTCLLGAHIEEVDEIKLRVSIGDNQNTLCNCKLLEAIC